MKRNLVEMLTCVVVYTFTFGVVLIWVGNVSTAHAGLPQQANWISVPAGTRILIRLSEPLSSTNQRVGARFTGRLETNLMAQGVVAAPRQTTVHGQVVSAESAGRMAGGSQLALELTDIVINDTAHPIMTDTYQLQGQGQGGQTARSVATGAGLGSVIGAIAGRGRGAAIGAAAGGGLGTISAASSGGGQQVNFAERNYARISAATASFSSAAPIVNRNPILRNRDKHAMPSRRKQLWAAGGQELRQ